MSTLDAILQGWMLIFQVVTLVSGLVMGLLLLWIPFIWAEDTLFARINRWLDRRWPREEEVSHGD
jgi:hypothetical protein